jgi:hypothetical protein
LSNKKILIVSRSFYPMNSPRSFRTTELVKEFARNGHDVTLLTPKDKVIHSQFEQDHGVKIKDLGQPSFSRPDISNGSSIGILLKRVLRRGLYQLFEYPDIQWMFKTKKALKEESGYDLLISIAVPHPVHWGVAKAWSENNPIARCWAADCGDPYMGARLDTFNKLFYFKYFEKDFCRKADYITVPIEGAKDGYYPEFREKIRVIPQGFNFEEVNVNSDRAPKNGVPTFAYAGGLIPGGRDPREFLNYLLQQDKDFRFIIYTRNRGLVDPFLEKANGRIEIRDYIPREELLSVLSSMDFLVNFENDTQLQLPSKLIDYYLAGRPVLNVPSENINRPDIDQFLEGNYQARHQFKDVDRYRIGNVCRQFLELCKSPDT